MSVRFWRYVNKTETCWLWTGGTTHGYGCIKKDRKGSMPASCASWVMHFGPIPKGMLVCHQCDVPLCVNPSHLFLGSHADNTTDAQLKGRLKHGEQLPQHKLTVQQVVEMRAASSQGATLRILAARYGVSGPHICAIINRKRWKHVA